MKLRKTLQMVVLFMLGIVIILAACSKNNEESGGKTASPAASSTTSPEASPIASSEPAAENAIPNMNASGLPIVKDKVTIKVALTKNINQTKPFDEMALSKMMENETNIHIEWVEIPTEQKGERKSLMLASGDLPDVFSQVLDDTDVATYGPQGSFIPLEDLIEKYAPNIKKLFEDHPEYKQSVTASDGHIYSLPWVSGQYLFQTADHLLINKTWLDKLQLSVPATLEEFEAVLKAFKEKDPNGNGQADEIPFMFLQNGGNRNGLYSVFGSFGVLDNPEHLMVRDSKVIFTPTQPGYKDGINWFHRLYAQGWIDPESFTMNTSQYQAKGSNKDIAIVGAMLGWGPPDTVGVTRYRDGEYVLVPPLKGPEGVQLWNRYYGGFSRNGYTITSANKHPEITMRWIDYTYSEKISVQSFAGPFGLTMKENGDGTYDPVPVAAGTTQSIVRFQENPYLTFAIPPEVFAKITPDQGNVERTDFTKFYVPYLPEQAYPDIFFSQADLQRISELKPDIYSFVDQKKSMWVMKGNADGEWNGYLDQLQKMKLDELLEIYQSNLDRYMQSK